MTTSQQKFSLDANSEPNAVTMTELIDPTSVGQSIGVIDQDVVKLSLNPFRGRRIEVRLGECHVIFHSTNLSVLTRTSLQSGFVAYTTFGTSAVGTVNGMQIGPEKMLVTVSGRELEFIVAAGYESIALVIPRERICDHAIRRHREDDIRIPEDFDLLTLSLENARELYDWGHRLVKFASRHPELFNNMQAQSAAEVELLELLLASLGSANYVEPSAHDLRLQKHSKVLQLAEDFAIAHIAERIHVSDLCFAAGVSERALQYAFRELLGMTPMTYLTQLRLHRVRQSLRAANHASTTVAKEALRWGFWHFGDFTRSYKECFDELPSDTLRKNFDSCEVPQPEV